MISYAFIHYFFVVSHVVIITFILGGWAFAKTRKVHLALIFLTLFSWLILGIWYGFGYCFWTDWHWQIQEKMGRKDLPESFVKFALDSLTRRDWDPGTVDVITVLVLLLVLCMSVYTNWRNLQMKKTARPFG